MNTKETDGNRAALALSLTIPDGQPDMVDLALRDKGVCCKGCEWWNYSARSETRGYCSIVRNIGPRGGEIIGRQMPHDQPACRKFRKKEPAK